MLLRSFGSPTLKSGNCFLISASNSSRTDSKTIARDQAEQVCPVFSMTIASSCLTPSSRFSLSKKIAGDLPPSSSVVLLTVSWASLDTSLPPLVDPVKEITSICLLVAIALPTSPPTPVTRFKTPFGRPAFSSPSTT